MTHMLAKTAAAIVTASVLLGVAAVPASAYTHYVCKYTQKRYEKKGTLAGAIVGGIIGGSVANTHNKGLGTVLGAGAGAVVGSKMGHDNGKKACNAGNAYRTTVSYHHGVKTVTRYVSN